MQICGNLWNAKYLWNVMIYSLIKSNLNFKIKFKFIFAFSQDFVYVYAIKKVHSFILCFLLLTPVYRGIYLRVGNINIEKRTECATPLPWDIFTPFRYGLKLLRGILSEKFLRVTPPHPPPLKPEGMKNGLQYIKREPIFWGLNSKPPSPPAPSLLFIYTYNIA